MFALTSIDPLMVQGHPAPRLDRSGSTDPIVRLLERLQRLLDAGYMVAIERGPSAVDVVGCTGRARGGEPHEAAVMALVRGLDGHSLYARAAGGIEVSRRSLGAEHGDALIVEIETVDASLVIVATRASGDDPFGINEERAVRRMAEWIGDYVRLWGVQRSERARGDSLSAALDLIDIAMFVLDGYGRQVSCNGAARRLLEAGDGLRKMGGMLTASHLEDAARLQTAIALAAAADPSPGAATGQQAPVVSVRRKGLRPLSVAVMRGGFAARGGGLVVVHAVDPQCDIDHLLLPACALYGLTGAETRLAKHLVGGASLAEASARLRIQEPTARTYLKQIFTKTGTNRQASLVRLLLTSMVRTAPGIALTALN